MRPHAQWLSPCIFIWNWWQGKEPKSVLNLINKLWLDCRLLITSLLLIFHNFKILLLVCDSFCLLNCVVFFLSDTDKFEISSWTLNREKIRKMQCVIYWNLRHESASFDNWFVFSCIYCYFYITFLHRWGHWCVIDALISTHTVIACVYTVWIFVV